MSKKVTVKELRSKDLPDDLVIVKASCNGGGGKSCFFEYNNIGDIAYPNIVKISNQWAMITGEKAETFEAFAL